MFKLSQLTWSVVLLALVFGFSSCDDDDVLNPGGNPVIGTITDIAAADGRFNTLTAALERTGLDVTLNNVGANVTVFAPTDDAFEALGVDVSTLSNEALSNILLYHVISGNIQSNEIASGRSEVPTLNTQGPGEASLPITVDNDGSGITINGDADVIVADIEAVNGTIHAIDDVLMPPTLLARAALDGRFTVLAAALERTGLDEVVANAESTLTVFAPTDDAFAELNMDLNELTDEALADILTYHVLGAVVPAAAVAEGDNFVTTLSESGPDDSALTLLVNNTSGSITLNGDASVIVADVNGTNGVIHAIDKVLMPQSIVDFATKAAGTSALAGSVVEAGLVDALSVEGPLTVFAPVNDAFAAIADVTEDLTMEQLREVLTYHVVSGNVRSSDLAAGMVASLNTTNMIDIRSSGDTFFIQNGDTRVDFILTDIQGSNGVIHLIDAVLIPSDL